jgi:uncharacterized membrane protein
LEWLSLIEGAFGLALPLLDSVPVIRATLGFVLVFFLPGFAWTLVFFNGRKINIIERLALSFGLSIALVTLSMLALNRLIDMRITGFSAVLVIVTVTVVPVIFYCIKRLMGRRGSNTDTKVY